MPTVVVTDYTFADLDIERAILASHDIGLDARRCKTADELIACVADADAVITQFSPITAPVVAAMRRAKAIIRYGVGVDNVDLAAARAAGIPVCNVPDYCVDEVADHTLALILALTRQVVPHCVGVRGGAWKLAVPPAGMRTLRDTAAGVVGFGRIGRAVVRRLVAFGGPVRVFDPISSADDIRAAGAEPVSTLADLLAGADVVTLHCPSTAETRRLMNAAAFAGMKPGAVLVNLGRGDLVDRDALLDALRSGRLGGAALDVFDPEPIPPGHPVLAMSNVIFSPHIASVSEAAVRRLRVTVARLAVAAVLGEPLANVVNGVPHKEAQS